MNSEKKHSQLDISKDQKDTSQTQVQELMNWFKDIGFKKKWVYGANTELLTNNLTAYSEGKSTDFLIWNCLGFDWIKNDSGGFPLCELRSGMEASIVQYFKERIEQVATQLASIGNPNLFILVPTQEAFDEQIWQYAQSIQERETIVKEAKETLKQVASTFSLSPNVTVSVLRWDEYLRLRGAMYSQQEYSHMGRQALNESVQSESLQKDAITSGQQYFEKRGFSNLDNEEISRNQLDYYGMYMGEGLLWMELLSTGITPIVLNFEELRVSKLSYLGAQGNLSIVTPITSFEMIEFYAWEKAQEALIKENENRRKNI